MLKWCLKWRTVPSATVICKNMNKIYTQCHCFYSVEFKIDTTLSLFSALFQVAGTRLNVSGKLIKRPRAWQTNLAQGHSSIQVPMSVKAVARLPNLMYDKPSRFKCCGWLLHAELICSCNQNQVVVFIIVGN